MTSTAATKYDSNQEPNRGLRRHALLTAPLLRKLPELGSAPGTFDTVAHVKFFWTGPIQSYLNFYATEFDGVDEFYGVIQTVDGNYQWVYRSLRDLANATYSAWNVPSVERDRSWKARPVGEIVCGGSTD